MAYDTTFRSFTKILMFDRSAMEPVKRFPLPRVCRIELLSGLTVAWSLVPEGGGPFLKSRGCEPVWWGCHAAFLGFGLDHRVIGGRTGDDLWATGALAW